MDARKLTRFLNGNWHGHYGVAPCPVCQIENRRDQNALTLSDGESRLLLNCKRSNCAFEDILAAVGLSGADWTPPDAFLVAQRRAEQIELDAKKARQAKAIWDESLSMHGTLAEAYLRGRGISTTLPDTLRLHPDCFHGPSAKKHPAMIAAVQSLHGQMSPAIHRTYLKADGSGKVDASPAKMMLGKVQGGCVPISQGAGPLVATEGIETGLSLLSGLLNESDALAVAALSASGMANLILPPSAGRLIIASDGDNAGREAANSLGFRAQSVGWHVEMLAAPEGYDFNDVLMLGVAE